MAESNSLIDDSFVEGFFEDMISKMPKYMVNNPKMIKDLLILLEHHYDMIVEASDKDIEQMAIESICIKNDTIDQI